MDNCIFCKKSINKRYGLNRHYKTCKELSNTNCIDIIINYKEIILTLEQQLKEDKEKLQTEINVLKEKNQSLQTENKFLKQTNANLEKQVEKHQSTINSIASQNKTIQNIYGNTHTTNTTNTLNFNTIKNMTQNLINSEMSGINLRDTNDPFVEISNHVNNSQIGMNILIKDKARNRIVYKDENSNERNDIDNLGKMIHTSIRPQICDIKYSNHREENKKYRKKINELSENNTAVYRKIMRTCIQSFRSLNEIQTMREPFNNKLIEISNKIKSLYEEYDPEGKHHLKCGIDALFHYIITGLHDYIVYKNDELYIILGENDILDSEHDIKTLIYKHLDFATYIKISESLKKSCSTYEGTLQEIIDLFKAKDEVKIKARIQNQIDALSLLNYDDD